MSIELVWGGLCVHVFGCVVFGFVSSRKLVLLLSGLTGCGGQAVRERPGEEEEMAQRNAVCLYSNSLTTGVGTIFVYLHTKGVKSNLCRIAMLMCPRVCACVPIIRVRYDTDIRAGYDTRSKTNHVLNTISTFFVSLKTRECQGMDRRAKHVRYDTSEGRYIDASKSSMTMSNTTNSAHAVMLYSCVCMCVFLHVGGRPP